MSHTRSKMRSAARQRGLSAVEVTVICVVVLALAALLLPMLAFQRGGRGAGSRMMQNSTQLRGIHHGMFMFALSNKTGGGDGWYPGLDARGRSIEVGDAIPGHELGAASDVPGYAAAVLDHVLPGEMNETPQQGFLTRAMAELMAGDFIPAGTASYFVNPVDTVKSEFLPGAGLDFTAANLSHTWLNVSREDGGLHPLKVEWGETINPQAIVGADRAVGDGDDAATRSSVWTDPGSGDWRGSLVRNDGSTHFEEFPGAGSLRYGKADFDALHVANLFSRSFAVTATGTDRAGDPIATELSTASGVLYDEADTGTDPNAF